MQNVDKNMPFSIGKRSGNASNHWQNIDLNNYSITRPTVLCFGGNMTKTPKDANAMCKVAEGLLSKTSNYKEDFCSKFGVDIIGIAYGEDRVGDKGHLSAEETKELSSKIFYPLFKNSDGSPKSVQEAQKGFSNISFLSHCAGATAISGILNDVKNEMIKCGYSQTEIQSTMGQMNSVTYAPLQPIPLINNLEVYSGADERFPPPPNRQCLDLWERDYRGVAINKEEGNTVSLYTDSLTNDNRNGDHAIQTINSGTKKAEAVSSVMSRALTCSVINSINNSNSNQVVANMSSSDMYNQCDSQLQKIKEQIRQEKAMKQSGVSPMRRQ